VLEDSNIVVLNGTTPVPITFPSGDNIVDRLIAAQVEVNSAGQCTIEDTGSVARFQAGTQFSGNTGRYYTTSHRLFVNAFSSAAGVTRYGKVFWHNQVGSTFTGISPTYRLTADPRTRIRQGISATLNDSAVATPRTTAPAGITFVDDNVDQIGADLAGGDVRQGVWIEFASTPSDPIAPFADSFTTQITVSSI
jgi:hypothetical protein